MESIKEERHPLQPFLPSNARVLMLGSFPPPQERWCMQFYYPNYENDMWRVMGEIFYSDTRKFVVKDEKRFDKEAIIAFLNEKGIAIYDAATVVKRMNNNASDKFLKIMVSADIPSLLRQLPLCRTIAVTGQKAGRAVSDVLQVPMPRLGKKITFIFNDEIMIFRLVPSTSRAYPISFKRKVEAYRRMFEEAGIC